jgi:hypothetical protein
MGEIGLTKTLDLPFRLLFLPLFSTKKRRGDEPCCREFTHVEYRESLQKRILERSMAVLLNIRAKILHFTSKIVEHSRHLLCGLWLAYTCCRQAERRQHLVQFFSVRLQPGRQFQTGTQLLDWLIHREARRIGRDLEEDASRFAEVNRVEVLAIQLVNWAKLRPILR